MTKLEKQNYLNKNTIGYWSDWGGVEVKGIEYGINDYAIIYIRLKKSVHRVRINYGRKLDRDYIRIHGRRLYLNECLRVD